MQSEELFSQPSRLFIGIKKEHAHGKPCGEQAFLNSFYRVFNIK